jgi:hypothetical protein
MIGIVILIVIVAAWGLSYLWLNQEVPRKVEIQNPEALLLYRMRPNDEENDVDSKQNRALAVEMATRAARELAVTRSGWVS